MTGAHPCSLRGAFVLLALVGLGRIEGEAGLRPIAAAPLQFSPGIDVLVPIQSVLNNFDLGGSGYALVAKKDMVVRIFAVTGDVAPWSYAEADVCVDDLVEECPAGNLFRAQGTVFDRSHAFSPEERREGKNSLNVFIVGIDANRVLTAGEHEFHVKVFLEDTGSTMSDRFTGVFREGPRLNVFTIPIIVEDEDGNAIGPEDSPDPGLDEGDSVLLAEAADFVKSVYPVNEEDVKSMVLRGIELEDLRNPPDGSLPFTQDDRSAAKNAFINQILVDDKEVADLYDETVPGNNFVLAVVNNVIGQNNQPLGTTGNGNSALGFTATGQSSPRAAAALDRQPSGDATLGHPDGVVLEQVVAHEFGHLFGFGDEYTNGSDSVVNPAHSEVTDDLGTSAGYYIRSYEGGFDVSGLRPKLDARNEGRPAPAYPPRHAVTVRLDPGEDPDVDPIAEGPIYGYMGGSGRSGVPAGLGVDLEGTLDTRAWTRQLNYEYLYGVLTQDASSSSSLQFGSPSPREVIHVSGSVTQSGQVRFDSFLVATTDTAFPWPTGTGYSVQLRDLAGAVLDEVPFAVSFVEEFIFDGLNDADEAPFGMVVDLPPNTGAVSLLQQGSLLRTFVKSPNPPTVGIVSARRTGDQLTVHWGASDPDGDPLVYIVMYSPNGTDRYVLATDTRRTARTASLEGLPAPDANARVIVHARDGFNVTEDSSAIDMDSDGDSVPDVSDNCPGIPNPSQADADADARGDACDCAPSDASAWAVPAEVIDLRVNRAPLGPDYVALAWDSLSAQSGPATVYDVITGTIGTLRSNQGFASHECLASDEPGTGIVKVQPQPEPPLPNGYWYLVRARNSCGNGTRGDGSGTPDPRDPLDAGAPCEPPAMPVLAIGKTDSPDPVATGSTLTYTLAYSNTGTADATGVVVRDTLPANTTFVSATGGGSLSMGVVTWAIGTLAAGSAETLQMVVRVGHPLTSGSSIANSSYGVASNETGFVGGPPVSTTALDLPILAVDMDPGTPTVIDSTRVLSGPVQSLDVGIVVDARGSSGIADVGRAPFGVINSFNTGGAFATGITLLSITDIMPPSTPPNNATFAALAGEFDYGAALVERGNPPGGTFFGGPLQYARFRISFGSLPLGSSVRVFVGDGGPGSGAIRNGSGTDTSGDFSPDGTPVFGSPGSDEGAAARMNYQDGLLRVGSP